MIVILVDHDQIFTERCENALNNSLHMQTNYYINTLQTNTFNSNKYVYIDSFDGNISIENNKWKYDLNFYLIQNAILPPSCYQLDLSSTIGEYKNIQLFEKQTSYIPYFISQQEYCTIYTCSFTAEVSPEMLTNDITNAMINFYPTIYIDEKVFKDPNYKTDVTTTNNFMNELATCKISANFNYSNVVNVANNQSGVFQDCTKIYLNSKTQSYYTGESIYIENALKNNYQSIADIAYLITEKNIIVKKVKYNFIYSLDGGAATQEFIYEENVEKVVDYAYKISLPCKTFFDGTKVREDNAGVLGFMIPVASQVQTNICVLYTDNVNNVRKININFDFEFKKQEHIYDDISKKDTEIEVDAEFENNKYYD
jgi:hypothetical protein